MCDCRPGFYLCREAERLWRLASACLTDDLIGYVEARAAYDAHIAAAGSRIGAWS